MVSVLTPAGNRAFDPRYVLRNGHGAPATTIHAPGNPVPHARGALLPRIMLPIAALPSMARGEGLE